MLCYYFATFPFLILFFTQMFLPFAANKSTGCLGFGIFFPFLKNLIGEFLLQNRGQAVSGKSIKTFPHPLPLVGVVFLAVSVLPLYLSYIVFLFYCESLRYMEKIGHLHLTIIISYLIMCVLCCSPVVVYM